MTNKPIASEEMKAQLAQEVAETVCRDVAELPDRTSPEDWPEAMLVTADELQLIVAREITEALSEIGWTPIEGDGAMTKELRSVLEKVRHAIATRGERMPNLKRLLPEIDEVLK